MADLIHTGIFLFSLFVLIVSSFGYTCKNEHGQTVDWFVIYKLPKAPHKNEHIANGVGYMYITSKDNNGWILSNNSINNNSSLLGRTISDLFSKDEKGIWLAYNDQALNGTFKTGHTKGIVGADNSGGIWIIHSIPYFPGLKTEGYQFPNNALRNGQSILCISASKIDIDGVGDFLLYNQPHFYIKTIQDELKQHFPKLISVVKTVVYAPFHNLTKKFSSKGHKHFQVFAKGKEFKQDLYKWVANTLHTDLLTETWAPNLSSSCLPKRVMNVKSIRNTKIGISFTSTKDHSKWAVSSSNTSTWICIGDINRAQTQLKRGGGTVCINDKKLWSAYYELISSFDNCKRPRGWERMFLFLQ